MANNKLSFLVESLVPQHVQENNPGFSTFIGAYFEYLEREFGEYDAVANLLTYRDIDDTVDEFLNQFVSTYVYPLSENTASNLKSIIKQIRKYYQSKGSQEAYKYLFKAMYNSSLEFYFPSDDLLKTSTRGRHLSEKTGHIIDSNYWQDFSYVLRTGVPANVYEKLLYALGHPAGLKLFGEFKPPANEMLLEIELLESLLILLLLDEVIGINGINFSLPNTEAEQTLLLQKVISGVIPTTSTFLQGIENGNYLLSYMQDELIEIVDGQQSEQQMLLFYDNIKQDMDSFRIDNIKLELLSNTEVPVETYEWDLFSNVTSSLQTDIGFTATDTITSENIINLDYTNNFTGTEGDFIKVVTTSGLNDGIYKIATVAATAITVTNTDDSPAALTTETAAAAGESKIYTVNRTQWYNTTLRDQPVLADKSLHYVRLPNSRYGSTTKAIYTNSFVTFSNIADSSDLIVFHNGLKVPSSELSFSGPNDDGFRVCTIASQFISAAPLDNIEYYSCLFTEDSWTLAVTGNTFTLNYTPNNILVFVKGVFLLPTEYTISGGDITIPDAKITELSADGFEIEVIYLSSDYNGQFTYNTFAGQTQFELIRPVEKKKFADSSESIRIWEGTTPNTGTDPTPLLSNDWNYTGSIGVLNAGEPAFPADWDENLYATPFNYNYNALGNATDGDSSVPYARNEKMGEYYPADAFRTTGAVNGVNNGNLDTTAITSKLLRHASNGGKYVARFDNVTADATELHALIVACNANVLCNSYNLSNTRSFTYKFGGQNYNFGTYEASPTTNQLWSATDSIYLFLDLTNDLMQICFNGNNLMPAVSTTLLSNFLTITGTRSGDDTNSIRMDYDPDLSGVSSFPAGTTAGDWTGWGDWTQWKTEYSLIAFDNIVSDFSLINTGGPLTLSQGADGSVLYTDRLVSKDVVLPGTGNYVLVVQSTHQNDIQTYINVEMYLDSVKTGQTGFMVPECQIINNYYGTNSTALMFTGTAGQTFNFEAQGQNATAVSNVKNCYLIRRL